MQAPSRLDFTPEQIEQLIDRLNAQTLAITDYPLLADLLRAMVWLNCSLQEKNLSIQRLRAVFGIKTESAKKLMNFAQGRAKRNRSQENAGNRGHRPSSDYTRAKTIQIAHQTMKKRDLCPRCGKGKLFNLQSGTVIRIVGQPWLEVEIWKPERLRCPVCGEIFTAVLPPEVATRVDHTAKAIVSLLKYKAGLPFYRQAQVQKALGTPISASEIWKMTEDVADALLPIYGHLCHAAAQAELIQNDDTKARILSLLEERKKEQEGEESKRRGTFTTGILATLPEAKIGLFFTGRNHAGENLENLLDKRIEEAPLPIQQCDGGHNIPATHPTQVSNCLAHARRKFYELVELWPRAILKVIGFFSLIFAHEKEAPSNAEERLRWHQEKSQPVMEELKEYCNALLEKREVEPNSSLGKAIAYLKNHWEGLTLFLRIPGVPLTNNDTERLLKRAVLNRKNAYFYRNETGAKIGDILMSMIETCTLNRANPWDYLIAIQEHQREVRKNPLVWMPWNFEQRLKELRPP